MAFKDRLKSLRLQAGLTQDRLARATDLTVSTVSKLEQGWTEPSWATVQQLALALGVSVEAFRDTEPPAKRKGPPAKRKYRKSDDT
jgi:transcriptional regulator with XRE-family HTH domain